MQMFYLELVPCWGLKGERVFLWIWYVWGCLNGKLTPSVVRVETIEGFFGQCPKSKAP